MWQNTPVTVIVPAVLIISITVDQCWPMGSLNPQVQLKDNKPISRRKQQYYPGLGLLSNPSESHVTSKQKGIMEDNLNMSNLNMSLFNILQFTQVTWITPPSLGLLVTCFSSTCWPNEEDVWLKTIRFDHHFILWHTGGYLSVICRCYNGPLEDEQGTSCLQYLEFPYHGRWVEDRSSLLQTYVSPGGERWPFNLLGGFLSE